MGGSTGRRLAAACVGACLVWAVLGCSSADGGGSNADGASRAVPADRKALLALSAYVPADSKIDFRLPQQMRDATGAVLPTDDASAEAWQSYANTVTGATPPATNGPIGFGRPAEGRWVVGASGAVPHPVPGVPLADVVAEIDIQQVLSILAVDADADEVQTALQSAAADMTVLREERDDGTMFDATCNGTYEACGLELVNGMKVWVGDDVVIAGLDDEVEAALQAAQQPNEDLRAILAAATDAGAGTGSVVQAPMQVTGDPTLLGCYYVGAADGTTPEACSTAARQQLDAAGNAPVDASMYLIGSAVEDGHSSIVFAVATDADSARTESALRAWQAGPDPRTGSAYAAQFGAPEVSHDDGVVVAVYPVAPDAPKPSTLWIELDTARSIPIVARAS